MKLLLGNEAGTCSGVQQSSSPVAPATCFFAPLVLPLSRSKRLAGCASLPQLRTERAVRILREAYAQNVILSLIIRIVTFFLEGGR